jgi:hypothetical protein
MHLAKQGLHRRLGRPERFYVHVIIIDRLTLRDYLVIFARGVRQDRPELTGDTGMQALPDRGGQAAAS